jgi:hypothetical protein
LGETFSAGFPALLVFIMKSLSTAQQEATDAILALKPMSDPHIWAKHNRLPRSVRPIRRRYTNFAVSLGFTEAQIYQQWRDIIDMVVITDIAE